MDPARIVLVGFVLADLAAENPASKKPATPRKDQLHARGGFGELFRDAQSHERSESRDNEKATNLLTERYDLSKRPAKAAVMDRAKPAEQRD